MIGKTKLAHPPRALLFDVFGTCVSLTQVNAFELKLN